MKIIPIAFYLPQFHPTPINDQIWGPGFTEWHNVARGKPLFDGHEQPRLPGQLGFYDLRSKETLLEQALLAKAHGIEGFCFYYYRSGSRRVLDAPSNVLLAHPSIDMPFIYCWANESWTRAWDGRSGEVVLEQRYDGDTLHGFLTDIVVAMSDRRYVRIDGRPLLLSYQTEHIPLEWYSKIREKLHRELHEDVLLGAVFSHGFRSAHAELVDFVVQFPPHRLPRRGARQLLDAATVAPYDPGRNDVFEAYVAVRDAALGCLDAFPHLVPGVCPDWDNSVRRPSNAHILVGSTAPAFGDWVREASRRQVERCRLSSSALPLLFVNAWNEWCEGAILEPSWTLGRRYLEALADGLRTPHLGGDGRSVDGTTPSPISL